MAGDEGNVVTSNEDRSSDDESVPASSVTAPRKRTRGMEQKISCELCKARKVKCDRAEPACSWCARHNRTCVYLKRQRPGSRASINAELEAKVNRIDGLLYALGRRVEEHITRDHAVVFDGGLSPSVGSRNTSSPASGFRHPVNGVVGHSGDVHGGSVPAPSTQGAPGQTPVHLPTAMAWQPDNSNNNNGNNNNGGMMTGSVLPNGNDVNPAPGVLNFPSYPSHRTPKADLPPHDMLYTLVDLYFKHCNTWCPVLERKTIFATFFGATSLEEPDRVLLHAIVATTLRFSKDPRLTPEMREYYHTTSKKVVRLYAIDNVSVPALRALVVVSLDEFGTANGPRAWNLLALLAQNVRQLGLCDEGSVYLSASDLSTPPPQVDVSLEGATPRQVGPGKPDSWIEDEGRRRLCWVVYLLDRYATVVTATFDFFLDDRTMQRFLPSSYDLFSKNVPVETPLSAARDAAGAIPGGGAATPLADATGGLATMVLNKAENLGSFSYHCALLRILSRVYDFIRAPVDITSSADMAHWRNRYQALDASLDGWLRGLPSEFGKISALCHSDPASRVANWFMLHSAYVTAVVRLHAVVAYPAARSALFMPSQYAVERCLSAVHSLADIVRDVREANGLDLLGPPFAFSLWVAARLLLVHASSVSAGAAGVDDRIDFFIETLRHVGQHWEVANNYAAILSRVVQRARQGVRTYASMRRSAHDLQVLTATKRQSGAEPTSTQFTSLCELDSIDVFAFFDYPITPEVPALVANSPIRGFRTQPLNGPISDMRRPSEVPTTESEWIGLDTPSYS
ncbi:Transcription factor [Niveomyces insectorum RCEF 264]|uniref:Transcription factor n=1 Tax=Niveomyces insectorum RCEF 264 TaxID=1081102 RepID=A0A167W826_9HYPO|nr:Transcription factor [Niveomyces insectorum RCEF 264]